MKSNAALSLLLLLPLVELSIGVETDCELHNQTLARCHELEDVRYIDTYQLQVLRAPSFSRSLGPGHFRNLASLRQLDLSAGGIERIEPGSFAKLGSLQSLDLADNRISQLDEGAFDGLKSLHSLRLGNNAISRLPAALLGLKQLRLLDLSGNPLLCDCASLELRDALLARAVKISKKTLCAEPAAASRASLLKPLTKATCSLEQQDLEMQADQPAENIEGSGEVDEPLGEPGNGEEQEEDEELVQPAEPVEEAETAAPSPASSSAASTSEETAAASSSTTPASDGVSSEEDASKKESSTESSPAKQDEGDEGSLEPEGAEKSRELLAPDDASREESSTEESVASSASAQPDRPIVPDVEGSGESDDDGSGAGEGSGMIARMPAIDFNETSVEPEEEEEEGPSSTSTTSTTTETSWWQIVGMLNPFGATEAGDAAATSTTTTTTTTTSTSTEKSVEDIIKEEQLLLTTAELGKLEEGSQQSPRTSELPKQTMEKSVPLEKAEDGEPAFSQESKKGMGSYVVLAALLAILAALIGFAAYKGDFCRRKRKRGDVERGTELKDMQRSLLEQSSQPQAKIQLANGSTLENVPLMNASGGTAPPEEPRHGQKSYDVSPLSNGSSKPTALDEPVKPPRKQPGQEIEAPLNGLNPPMEPIDAPLHNGSNGDLSNGADYGERLSPGAQRVMITMQDNPDSVPKTPILITRIKGGENLVKAP